MERCNRRVELADNRLSRRSGVDWDGCVRSGETRRCGASELRGRNDLPRREERTSGRGGDLNPIGRRLAHLLGAVMFAITAATGGKFLLLTGEQQGRDQRKAEGDQQQDDSRNAPHAPIVQRLATL